MPFPVHFRTTSGEVEAIFCLFPVSAYIKIENQNFVDRCTFVWSTWWRQKKFDKGRCLKKGHIVCIIKVRKWDGNFLTNLMLFPYVTKWGRSQLYYWSWGMRRTRRLEISLKLFLDQKDRLLNNLERLEHLRSLSVTIKTGKDEVFPHG